MTTTVCHTCENDSAKKTCWLCELEKAGGVIYYHEDHDGLIRFWTTREFHFKNNLTAKEFCALVRDQYPRGE